MRLIGLLLAQSLCLSASWSLFFSNEEKAPWHSAFETTDKDSDGFLSLDDLEPLLRDHFRRTEKDNPDHEMILANEAIFHDQAADVAAFFSAEGRVLIVAVFSCLEYFTNWNPHHAVHVWDAGTHGVPRFNFEEFEALMVAYM